MRNDKHLAIKLRKSGKSYNKINKELGVPKSTLSNWFSDTEWSKNLRKELSRKANYLAKKRLTKFNKERQEMWGRWREEARRNAQKQFSALNRNPLFLAGLMLYWAEGDSKLKNPFRLTNTDPRMIALYTKFLTTALHIPSENLRATVILYPDLSEKKCINFWSEIIGIPRSQFYKTQYIQGRHPTTRLTNGICMITCGNRQLKEKIIVWIDLMSQKLIQ